MASRSGSALAIAARIMLFLSRHIQATSVKFSNVAPPAFHGGAGHAAGHPAQCCGGGGRPCVSAPRAGLTAASPRVLSKSKVDIACTALRDRPSEYGTSLRRARGSMRSTRPLASGHHTG